MSLSPIRYISFDCYGTLVDFRVGDVTGDRLADRVPPDRRAAFLEDFTAYRFDEVLGAWKPYPEVLHRSLERTCRRWGVAFDPADAQAIIEAVPSWGPHPDVPAALAKVAQVLPLVILSNAADNQIRSNVEKLGAPFHAVLTAEQAQAYKPRFQAFEYMFDTLGCGPEYFVHVSSSLHYDWVSAHDLRIGRRVFVERGHGPGNPAYGYQAIADLGGPAGPAGANRRPAMSSAPVTERMLLRTTVSLVVERRWDDTLPAAYAPRRELRPENATAATPPSRLT